MSTVDKPASELPANSAFVSRAPSRRSVMKGVAWTTPLAAVAVAAPAVAVSPTDCQPAGTEFTARAGAQFLSGTIGGAELASAGTIALEQTPAEGPASTGSALNVGLLDSINLDATGLAGVVSDLLDITVGQDAGLINQFAQAIPAAAAQGSEGEATAEIGAAGAVSQATGAVSLSDSGAAAPTLGTIDLRTLVDELTETPEVSALLSSVTDLRLQIGALAGRAFMDSLCEIPDPEDPAAVQRDYNLSYVRLAAESPTVGAAVTGINDILGDELTIGNDVLADALEPLTGTIPGLGPVVDLLTRVLGGIVTANVTVDTGAVTSSAIPADPGAPVRLLLGGGGTPAQLVLDVGPLLGYPYTGAGGGLNGLAPNTQLLAGGDPLTADSATLVADLVNALIDQASDNITIDISALSLLGAGLINIQGTITDLLNGGGTVTVAGTLVTGDARDDLLDNLLGAVQTTIADSLDTALDGLQDLLSTIFTAINDILSLTVNAQSEPVIGDSPFDVAPGRFDVAPLHVSLIDAVDLLDLTVARGYVGPNDA